MQDCYEIVCRDIYEEFKPFKRSDLKISKFRFGDLSFIDQKVREKLKNFQSFLAEPERKDIEKLECYKEKMIICTLEQ